jgi:hypothetical protein
MATLKDIEASPLQRRVDAVHRSYETALHELERLQSEQPPEYDGASTSAANPRNQSDPRPGTRPVRT